mmetsp:Transcript_160742/g.308705  ORF Transcript_160742/g.308705 Transcript_160742/m.308705 type:complete len:501 (-) Transcript_160742:13-1515(-)
MMQEDDERIKKLQEKAWGLQTCSNKPGKPLPDAFKRECYRVASRALSLCADAVYMDENDWLKRTKGLSEEIEAQKLKVKEVEDAELQKRVGKCYRATTGGGYAVGNVTAKATKDAAKAIDNTVSADALSTTASVTSASLTAAEIVARCGEDPEMLWLVNRDLGDANMEAICEGLRRGGAQLTALDLSHNSLADVGVQRLVTALASGACPKLKELWIGGNSFGELGRQMLVSGLGALRRGLLVHADVEDNARGHDAGSGASSDVACPAGKATADQRDCSGATLSKDVASEASEALGTDSSDTQPLDSGAAANSQARNEAPAVSAADVPKAAEVKAMSLVQEPVAPPSTSVAEAKAEAEAGTEPVPEEELPAFIASDSWTGSRPGYFFGTGDKGLGYHRDLKQPRPRRQKAEDGNDAQSDRLTIDLVPGPASSQVRAVLALPDSVSCAQDLELDVSASRFIVRLRDGSLVADAALPSAVDPDSAQAVFSRRRRTMTVLLDVP